MRPRIKLGARRWSLFILGLLFGCCTLVGSEAVTDCPSRDNVAFYIIDDADPCIYYLCYGGKQVPLACTPGTITPWYPMVGHKNPCTHRSSRCRGTVPRALLTTQSAPVSAGLGPGGLDTSTPGIITKPGRQGDDDDDYYAATPAPYGYHKDTSGGKHSPGKDKYNHSHGDKADSDEHRSEGDDEWPPGYGTGDLQGKTRGTALGTQQETKETDKTYNHTDKTYNHKEREQDTYETEKEQRKGYGRYGGEAQGGHFAYGRHEKSEKAEGKGRGTTPGEKKDGTDDHKDGDLHTYSSAYSVKGHHYGTYTTYARTRSKKEDDEAKGKQGAVQHGKASIDHAAKKDPESKKSAKSHQSESGDEDVLWSSNADPISGLSMRTQRERYHSTVKRHKPSKADDGKAPHGHSPSSLVSSASVSRSSGDSKDAGDYKEAQTGQASSKHSGSRYRATRKKSKKKSKKKTGYHRGHSPGQHHAKKRSKGQAHDKTRSDISPFQGIAENIVELIPKHRGQKTTPDCSQCSMFNCLLLCFVTSGCAGVDYDFQNDLCFMYTLSNVCGPLVPAFRTSHYRRVHCAGDAAVVVPVHQTPTNLQDRYLPNPPTGYSNPENKTYVWDAETKHSVMSSNLIADDHKYQNRFENIYQQYHRKHLHTHPYVPPTTSSPSESDADQPIADPKDLPLYPGPALSYSDREDSLADGDDTDLPLYPGPALSYTDRGDSSADGDDTDLPLYPGPSLLPSSEDDQKEAEEDQNESGLPLYPGSPVGKSGGDDEGYSLDDGADYYYEQDSYEDEEETSATGPPGKSAHFKLLDFYMGFKGEESEDKVADAEKSHRAHDQQQPRNFQEGSVEKDNTRDDVIPSYLQKFLQGTSARVGDQTPSSQKPEQRERAKEQTDEDKFFQLYKARSLAESNLYHSKVAQTGRQASGDSGLQKTTNDPSGQEEERDGHQRQLDGDPDEKSEARLQVEHILSIVRARGKESFAKAKKDGEPSNSNVESDTSAKDPSFRSRYSKMAPIDRYQSQRNAPKEERRRHLAREKLHRQEGRTRNNKSHRHSKTKDKEAGGAKGKSPEEALLYEAWSRNSKDTALSLDEEEELDIETLIKRGLLSPRVSNGADKRAQSAQDATTQSTATVMIASRFAPIRPEKITPSSSKARLKLAKKAPTRHSKTHQPIGDPSAKTIDIIDPFLKRFLENYGEELAEVEEDLTEKDVQELTRLMMGGGRGAGMSLQGLEQHRANATKGKRKDSESGLLPKVIPLPNNGQFQVKQKDIHPPTYLPEEWLAYPGKTLGYATQVKRVHSGNECFEICLEYGPSRCAAVEFNLAFSQCFLHDSSSACGPLHSDATVYHAKVQSCPSPYPDPVHPVKSGAKKYRNRKRRISL